MSSKVPKSERAALYKPTSRRKFKRTSIGKSPNTKPTNKHKRRQWKKYRGQG